MAFPFIVFEGIDGCGKGTQIELFERYVRKRRERCFTYKFPSEAAKQVREHLSGKAELDEDTLFSRYLEDIAAHQSKIASDMQKGWVLADRYCVSTAAYQSEKTDLTQRMAMVEAAGLRKADVCVWLDAPVAQTAARKSAQKLPDRFEGDAGFQQRVSENYAKLYPASFMASEWLRVDATLPPKRMHEFILSKLEL